MRGFESDGWLSWLDENNKEQLIWARKYLLKKEVFMAQVPEERLYERLLRVNLEDRNPKEFVRGMRIAWNQKEFKKKISTHKKSYNFILSKKVKLKLDALAKQNKKPISETLESYIDRCFELEKELRIERRKEIEGAKNKAEQRPASSDRRNLNAAKDTLHHLQNFMSEQLHEQCKYLVILEDHGLLNNEVNIQEERIQNKMRDKNEKINKIMTKWPKKKDKTKISSC